MLACGPVVRTLTGPTALSVTDKTLSAISAPDRAFDYLHHGNRNDICSLTERHLARHSALLEGAKMTLWISVLGLAGGLVIGLAAGFACTFGGWFANHIALVFIEIIRGTPIVVQVMFIYFALPMAFNDLRIDPFSAAVVTIMINSGAYIAEITRGAVLSIHKGFREAGLALGLLAGKPSAMLFYRLLCAVCRRWAISGSLASKTPRCLLLSA